MKRIIPSILFLALSCFSFSQEANPKYNKSLADSLGADDYGMKTYVLVILKTGPAKIDNKAVTDSLFRGHMAFIQRMADKGILTVAGPLMKNDKAYRGIYIFDLKSTDEANSLLSGDPSIKAGIFETESFVWYGSAALPVYLKTHEKLEKFKL